MIDNRHEIPRSRVFTMAESIMIIRTTACSWSPDDPDVAGIWEPRERFERVGEREGGKELARAISVTGRSLHFTRSSSYHLRSARPLIEELGKRLQDHLPVGSWVK